MIRINLLGVERKSAKKAMPFDVGQRITVACSLILVVTGLGLGWWYWALTQSSARVDADIVSAQREAARLQSVMAEVRQGEQRRAQLQQRVALIEQLRSGQSVPVQLLDHVSRSLPDMIWLSEMRQDGDEVTISGRSTTLISLSDFVGNLGKGGLMKKPIELVNSQVESAAAVGPQQGPAVDLISFTVKAQLASSTPAAPAPSASAPTASAPASPSPAAAAAAPAAPGAPAR